MTAASCVQRTAELLGQRVDVATPRRGTHAGTTGADRTPAVNARAAVTWGSPSARQVGVLAPRSEPCRRRCCAPYQRAGHRFPTQPWRCRRSVLCDPAASRRCLDRHDNRQDRHVGGVPAGDFSVGVQDLHAIDRHERDLTGHRWRRWPASDGVVDHRGPPDERAHRMIPVRHNAVVIDSTSRLATDTTLKGVM